MEGKNTEEKACAFYVSDYHFEMISLPYINQKIENDEDVIILTQNNLEETIKQFLDRTNLKDEKKERILELDWKNNDAEKLQNIEKNTKEEKKTTIFIKGKEKYIHDRNENLEKYLQTGNEVEIIDCYEMEEVGENVDEIMEKYRKILQTTGEKEINKI